jgi:hypothetical protein
MTRQTESRIAEWAALVDASVPETAERPLDGEDH